MKVHILQHMPYEGLGSIAAWLESQKATIGYTRFFGTGRLPSPRSVNMVIAMSLLGSSLLNLPRRMKAATFVTGLRRLISVLLKVRTSALGLFGASKVVFAHLIE